MTGWDAGNWAKWYEMRSPLSGVRRVSSAALGGLISLAGLGAGVAAAWITWGVGAGLGASCVALLVAGAMVDSGPPR